VGWTVLAIAARVGSTRLIDNLLVAPGEFQMETAQR
jgi:pantothenate synthetase